MDLYSDNLDPLSFANIEEFLGMSGPVEARPTEGVVLDYKVADSADWVETIAAFANSAGGLLFLGVQSDRKQNNAPVAVPGIEFFGGDIKARLTAKIVSRVIPRPDFDVVATALPTEASRFVAIVRVREGTYPPYQYSKESDRVRFPIRIQDTSRDASLRDMEYLFEKRGSFSETTETRVLSFSSTPLFPQFLKDYDSPAVPEQTAKPYHVWSIRPRVPLRLRLDKSFDRAVLDLIRRHFPDSNFGQFWPPAMSADRHIVRWQGAIDSNGSAPMRWARNIEWTSSGDLRFAERIDRREWSGGESVSDLYVSGLRFLNLMEDFYRSHGSYGSLSALHTVVLQPEFKILLTFPDGDGVYRETDSISFSPMRAKDGTDVSNVTTEMENLAPGNRVEVVCDIMLSHLRQLRQATINYEKLIVIVAGCPIDKPLGYFP
jgi:hypothetical protein